MPLPRLIHPVNVTIERIDDADMLMDDDTREPIHGARNGIEDVVIIPAQVKIESADEPDPEVGGVHMNQSGYILCRKIDMDQKLGTGIRFKKGDRITAMGHRTGLDLYITRNEPMGHYPSQDGASLYRYYFEDRAPVQVK